MCFNIYFTFDRGHTHRFNTCNDTNISNEVNTFEEDFSLFLNDKNEKVIRKKYVKCLAYRKN